MLDLVRWARRNGPVLSMEQLRELVCWRAPNPLDVVKFGTGWVRALVSLADRAGVAHLERDATGTTVLKVKTPLPDDEQVEAAWHRAFWGDRRPRNNSKS